MAGLTAVLALAGCGSTTVVTDTGSGSTATASTGTGTTTSAATSSTQTAPTTSTSASTTTPTTTTPTTATSTTATTPTTSTTQTTATTPAAATAASCGGQYEDVSGLSCTTALPIMNAWNNSSACEISDQGGSATSSNCQVDGYACSAKLGYPPGRTEGEMSPIVSCAETGKPALTFIRGI